MTLVLAMAVAQLADLASMLAMVHWVGLAAEANPLVRAIAAGSPADAALAKGALVAGVAAACAVIRAWGRPRLAESVLGLAIVVGLIGMASNVRVLVDPVA